MLRELSQEEIKLYEMTVPELDAYIDVNSLEDTFQKYFRIRDKKGKLVAFTLNKAQKIILKRFQADYNAGKPLRYIILKARQKGISTFWEAVMYWLATINELFKGTIVAQDTDASDNLFEMTKRYHDNFPLGYGFIENRNNRKELSLRENNSVIEIQTAEGGGKVKRSDTIQAAHLTEVEWWRDAKQTLLVLLQTVPDEPLTLIVLETTANGIGGPFYNRWQVAYGLGLSDDLTEEERLEYEGASDYQAIFISWLIDDEYTRPFKTPDEKQAFIKGLGNQKFNAYEDEEQTLMDEYGATLEHLNWRRKIITDKCDGDVYMFHQEYPSNPMEAFVTSGRPVFDIKICNNNLLFAQKLAKAGKMPLRRGDLVPVYRENDIKYRQLRVKGIDSYYDLKPFIKGMLFEDNPRGNYKIYGDVTYRLGEHYKYCASADVAEGLEQGDFDCMKVMNRKCKEIVLTYHGHTDPDLLANEQHKLSVFLGNDIYFATERNNHGLTTIISAHKLGVKQYYSEDFDKGYAVSTDVLGFRTTSGSRTPAINDLKEWIREEEFVDYEKEFWMEALTFVKNARGKMQAQDKDKDPGTKCFDDRIFAQLIMLRCHNWLPNYYFKPPDNEFDWLKRKIKAKKKGTSAMSG